MQKWTEQKEHNKNETRGLLSTKLLVSAAALLVSGRVSQVQ